MAAKLPRDYGRNDHRRTGVMLWLGVVSANLIGLFAAVYVSSYLRAGVGDPDTLFVFYYGALALGGVVDALWLDEMLFKGSFRRSVLGLAGSKQRKGDDVEVLAAEVQRGRVSFPVVVLVCCGLTYLLFNVVNRGFNSWWEDVGEHAHTLRSKDSATAAQQQAIVALSSRIQPEVLDILEAELHDGDPEVEAYAAWAIGRHRKNEVMNINRVPALVERVRNGAPQVQREAMIALGRLQHQAIADELQDALAAELDAGETVDIRLVWALGYAQHPDSLAVLDKALYHPDQTVQRAAAWALSQQRDSGKGRASADLLEQRLPAAPLATKCAIVHALGVLGDERSNLALMHAYESLGAEEREILCEPISVVASPDGKHDVDDLQQPRERYGMKTMQALGAMRATAPEIRGQIEPWLESVIARPDTADLTRETARSLLAGIRSQRDDSQ